MITVRLVFGKFHSQEKLARGAIDFSNANDRIQGCAMRNNCCVLDRNNTNHWGHCSNVYTTCSSILIVRDIRSILRQLDWVVHHWPDVNVFSSCNH